MAWLTAGAAPADVGHPAQDDAPFGVEDRFGRALHQRGVALVDWEGALANPRVELVVRPGAQIPANRYPLRVVVRASTPRLLLERFSRLQDDRSTKIVFLNAPGDVARFDLAVFPDVDGEDETHELRVTIEDAAESPWHRVLPVRVEDRDDERAPGLPLLLDFSHDASGFFDEAGHRAALERAAAELGDLLGDQGFAPVPAGEEETWVWDASGFASGTEVTNPEAYTGFRVVIHGIHHDALHSGSCASDRRPDALQRRGEETLGLRRSGTVAIETSGNWNERGWHVDAGDPLGWLRSRNLEGDAHDLLSVARHELLHALVYHRSHPGYAALLQDGHLVAPALRAYLGEDPAIDASEHLTGTVDPVSGFGAFGNEYGTVFPWRRWLPTKVDLLVLRAAGYRVRPHSCLTPLALGPDPAAEPLALQGPAGEPLALATAPRGGVPPYRLTVTAGALPEGLTLDGWTGALTGAAAAGAYEFTLRLEDQDRSSSPLERACRLTLVSPPPTPVEAGSGGEDGGGDATPPAEDDGGGEGAQGSDDDSGDGDDAGGATGGDGGGPEQGGTGDGSGDGAGDGGGGDGQRGDGREA